MCDVSAAILTTAVLTHSVTWCKCVHSYDVKLYLHNLVILCFRLIGRSWSDIHVVASREYIQQGENLFLVCLIRVANIRFTWFKEGKLLTVPVTGPGVLQVPNTSDSDLGNYTCRATTDNASPVAFASIIVKRFGKFLCSYFM